MARKEVKVEEKKRTNIVWEAVRMMYRYSVTLGGRLTRSGALVMGQRRGRG